MNRYEEHNELKMCTRCYGLVKGQRKVPSYIKEDESIIKCNCNLLKEARNNNILYIDEGVFKAIQRLNIKGYRTMCCCEGHIEGSNTWYDGCIGLDNQYEFKIPFPEIFSIRKGTGRFENTLWLECKKKYKNKPMTMEDKKEYKVEFLKELNNWVEKI